MQKQDGLLRVDPKLEVDGRQRGSCREGLGRHKARRRVRLMRAAGGAAGEAAGGAAEGGKGGPGRADSPQSARKCKIAWPGNGLRKLPTAPQNQSS